MVVLHVRERGDPMMPIAKLAARRLSLAAIWLMSFSMFGCSVFVGEVTVRPTRIGPDRPGAFDNRAEETAVEIAASVAKSSGLSLVPGPYSRLAGEDYATLRVFQRNGQVWLSLLVKDDLSELVFVITDQRHPDETQLTSTMREGIVRQVAVKLPETEVEYVYRSEPSSLMAP